MKLSDKCMIIVATAMSLEIDFKMAAIVFRAIADLMDQVDKTPDASDEHLAELIKTSLIAAGIPKEIVL